MKANRKTAVIGAFANASQDKPVSPADGVGAGKLEPAMFGRILVPTDYSDPSKKALKYARRFVETFGSRVTLIHVVEPVMSPDFTSFPLALDEDKVLEAARQRLLVLGKSTLGEAALEGVIVRAGSPFHEISAAARDLKMDLIILATHGYTGVKRALLGSTAERVIRHAPCAVMTVR